MNTEKKEETSKDRPQMTKRVTEEVKIETVRMTIVRNASLPEEDLLHTLLTEVMGGRKTTDSGDNETDIVMSTSTTNSDAAGGPPILGAEGAYQQLPEIPAINSDAAAPEESEPTDKKEKSIKSDTVRMTICRNTMMPDEDLVDALLAEATDGKRGGFFFQDSDTTTSQNVEKQDFTHANDCLRRKEPKTSAPDEAPSLAEDVPAPSWGVEQSQPVMPKTDGPAKKADYNSAAEELLAQLKGQG